MQKHMFDLIRQKKRSEIFFKYQSRHSAFINGKIHDYSTKVDPFFSLFEDKARNFILHFQVFYF